MRTQSMNTEIQFQMSERFESETLKRLRELTEPEDAVDFLDDLISTYCSEIPNILKNLNDEVSRKNSQLVEKLAHRIKGSSKEMGATRMAMLCASLEDAGKISAIENFNSLYANIREEFLFVKHELETKWLLKK